MGFTEIFSITFLSLLPIINPIGMSSMFLALTGQLDAEERHKVAYRVATYSFLLLLGVLFAGKWVLEFFGLTLPFIRIAGGLLVSITAMQMLNAKPKLSEAEKKDVERNDEIAFFPLTLPITAGAGAIAIIIAVSVGIPTEVDGHFVLLYFGASLGILCMAILVAICYRFADSILNKIGKTGTAVITRLSAFILLAIGFEVIWKGLLSLIIIAKTAHK